MQEGIDEPIAPGSCCHGGTGSILDRDGPGVPQGIGHGFGDSGGDAAQVEEGEDEEEEVHGGVQAVVAGYGAEDEAQEGSQGDAAGPGGHHTSPRHRQGCKVTTPLGDAGP